jgi:hypothetical protein
VSFIDIDVDSQPSKEQELKDAQKVLKGDVPLIENAPSIYIEIPRGRFSSGKWETEVELRELTGADEEALARFNDPIDFFDGVLVYGTARIGSKQLTDLSFPERQSVLAELLVGEREQMFVHIARITYGDEKDISHTCPSCSNEAETTLILSEDIELPVMENPHTVTNTIVTSKGDEISYRLTTGSDQLNVLKRKGVNSAEQNTIILSQCITAVNGDPVVDPMNNARNLTMGDRRKILDLLVEAQPSPDMNLNLACQNCGFDMIIPLSWGDIFRP